MSSVRRSWCSYLHQNPGNIVRPIADGLKDWSVLFCGLNRVSSGSVFGIENTNKNIRAGRGTCVITICCLWMLLFTSKLQQHRKKSVWLDDEWSDMMDPMSGCSLETRDISSCLCYCSWSSALIYMTWILQKLIRSIEVVQQQLTLRQDDTKTVYQASTTWHNHVVWGKYTELQGHQVSKIMRKSSSGEQNWPEQISWISPECGVDEAALAVGYGQP